MACVAPRSHGGDAGGSPPRRPTRPIPAQCQGSMIRGETTNRALKKAFRENGETPLTLGFDSDDLGTFSPIGKNGGYLSSLIGEQIRPLPLACEWEEIPPACKAHIMPTLETYFNLAEWFNKQDKVLVGNNEYTVGERVKLGLEIQMRLLWRKYKGRIKSNHFKTHETPAEARLRPPPPNVWRNRTREDWEDLVDWWSDSDRMARSVRNAENRAKSKITTHQGKKSFARGRNEYKVKRGYCEDLIETWRKGHSKGGKFTNEENETRYHEMKALQDQSKAAVIPILTNQEILNRIVPSNNRANMSGRGRKLPGGGSTSRRSANPTFGSDVMTRDQITQLLRQEQQEKELYKKQAEEAQQRAYLAALKADAAAERAEAAHSSIGNFQSLLGQFFTHYNRPNSGPFSASFPQTNHVPVPGLGPALAPNWAHYLQPPIPYSQPLQHPYVSPTPIPAPTTSIPVIDDAFNNCYRPFVNSNSCPGSSSNSHIPENDLNGNYLLMNPHMNQNPQHDLNTHNFENEEGDEESAEEEVEVEDE